LPVGWGYGVSQLLERDPSKRFTWNEVKNHPFFKETDWDKMYRKDFKPEFVPKVVSFHSFLQLFIYLFIYLSIVV
jgi:serine/threonine protein kinase